MQTVIEAAAERIAPWIVTTPLLRVPALDARVGGQVLVKVESLQRTGSFKLRGALNAILALAPENRRAGVVTFSSGNHAAAVAEAAAIANVPAVVLMPKEAPAVKRDAAASRGAEIILYDRHRDDREAMCRAIVETRGMTLIPPYDHPDVIAGQGTILREALAQAGQAQPSLVLLPCGGGGLAAGCATALRAQHPDAALYVVEPAGFDDTRRSLLADTPQRNDALAGSICDSLLVPTPGALTLPILRAARATGIAVTEASVRAAVRFAFATLKLVLEPGGAVALAALLDGSVQVEGRTALVVCSGGNVDPAMFEHCLREDE